MSAMAAAAVTTELPNELVTRVVVSTPWFITLHALDRMNRMHLQRHQLTDVIEQADVDYPDGAERVAIKGNIAVVYDPVRRSILTVLLHKAGETYSDEERYGHR